MPFNCSESPLTAAWELSPARVQVFVAMYVFLTVVSVVLLVVFCIAKHRFHYERLRPRMTSLVVLSSAASFVFAQAGPAIITFGRWTYPCWLRSVLSMLVVPLFCASLMIKQMDFYFQAQLNRAIAAVDRVDDDAFQDSSSHTLLSGCRDFAFVLMATLFPRCMVIPQNRLVVALSFITSRRGTIWFTLTVCAISLAAALGVAASTRPEFSNGCTGCFLAPEEVMEIAFLSAVLFVFLIVFVVRAWRFPDPWGLRQEVFLSALGCVLALFGFVAGVYFDVPGDVPYDHQVEMCVGFAFVVFVQTALQAYKGWVEDAAAKKRYAKHASKVEMFSSRALVPSVRIKPKDSGGIKGGAFDVSMNMDSIGGVQIVAVEEEEVEEGHYGLEEGDDQFNAAAGFPADLLTLDKILASAPISKAFEEFMIAELGVESLMFIKDTDDWKRAYFTVAPNARVVRARRLFNVYMAHNAKFEINVSGKCSKHVKDAFARGGGVLLDVPLDVFDWARKEIADMLQYGSILRFQLTPQYRQLQLQLDKEQQQQQQRAPKLQRKSIF